MRNGESLSSNHASGKREEKSKRDSEVRISKAWCMMGGWEVGLDSTVGTRSGREKKNKVISWMETDTQRG